MDRRTDGLDGLFQPRFALGVVAGSRRVVETLREAELARALRCHRAGDWGEAGESVWVENDRALAERDAPLLSLYTAATGARFLVVTRPDRSLTRVSLVVEHVERWRVFDPGALCLQREAATALTRAEVGRAVWAHLTGNWGDLTPQEWAQNQRALFYGGKLRSRYHSADSRPFHVVTNAARTETLVCLAP